MHTHQTSYLASNQFGQLERSRTVAKQTQTLLSANSDPALNEVGLVRVRHLHLNALTARSLNSLRVKPTSQNGASRHQRSGHNRNAPQGLNRATRHTINIPEEGSVHELLVSVLSSLKALPVTRVHDVSGRR